MWPCFGIQSFWFWWVTTSSKLYRCLRLVKGNPCNFWLISPVGLVPSISYELKYVYHLPSCFEPFLTIQRPLRLGATWSWTDPRTIFFTIRSQADIGVLSMATSVHLPKYGCWLRNGWEALVLWTSRINPGPASNHPREKRQRPYVCFLSHVISSGFPYNALKIIWLECTPENLMISNTSKPEDYMSRSSSTKIFLSKLTALFSSAHCLTFSKFRQVCWTSATSFALLSMGSHFQGSGVMSTEHIRLCLRASRQWERCSMPINSCVASQVRFDQMRFRIMFYANRMRGPPNLRSVTKLTTQWSWWNTLSDTT